MAQALAGFGPRRQSWRAGGSGRGAEAPRPPAYRHAGSPGLPHLRSPPSGRLVLGAAGRTFGLGPRAFGARRCSRRARLRRLCGSTGLGFRPRGLRGPLGLRRPAGRFFLGRLLRRVGRLPRAVSAPRRAPSPRVCAPPGAFSSGFCAPPGAFPSGFCAPPGAFSSGFCAPPGAFSPGFCAPPGAFSSGFCAPPGAFSSGFCAPPGAFSSGFCAPPGAFSSGFCAPPGVFSSDGFSCVLFSPSFGAFSVGVAGFSPAPGLVC